MADRSMVAKLILDASTYQQGINLAKQGTQQITKELELWRVKNNVVAGSAKDLAKVLSSQKDTMKVLDSQIAITRKKYEEQAKATGENSAAAMNYKNKLTSLEIEQAKLNKTISNAENPLKRMQASLNSTSKTLETVGRKFQSIGGALTKGVTVPVMAAVASIVMLADSSGKFADELLKTSSATGISVEKLQELKYISGQIGASYDAVISSTAKFTRAVNDGLKPESEMAKVLGLIGVNAQEVIKSGKPMNEVFFETIRRIGQLKDANMQDIISSEIFGRSFQELLPWIRLTSEQMEAYKKHAKDMNIIRTEEDIFALDKLGDKLADVKSQIENAGREFLIGLNKSGTLDKLADSFENTILPALGKLIVWVGKLADEFGKLSPERQEGLLKTAAVLVGLGPVFSGVGGLISGVGMFASGLSKLKISAAFMTQLGMVAGWVAVIGGLVGVAQASVNDPKYIDRIQKSLQENKPVIMGYQGLPGDVIMPDTDNYKKFKKDYLAEHPITSKGTGVAPKYVRPDVENMPASAREAMERYNKPVSETNNALGGMDSWMDDLNKKWAEYTSNADKAASKTDKLKDSTDDLNNSMKGIVNSLKSQTSAFANFTGLFDKFERTNVSGERLLNRLKAQVKAMTEWRTALATLEKRGVSAEFITDMRSMGPSSVDNVTALSKLSDAKLKEYTSAYDQKFTLGGAEALTQTKYQNRIDTNIEKQTNLTISSFKMTQDEDMTKLLDKIVAKLRLAGVKV